MHAIGDRANGLVLDAFEAALKDANVSALRPRLEHAQILAQEDMARFGDLGGTSCLNDIVSVGSHRYIAVIASIQPTHAYVTACPGIEIHIDSPHRTSDMWFGESRLVSAVVRLCRRMNCLSGLPGTRACKGPVCIP